MYELLTYFLFIVLLKYFRTLGYFSKKKNPGEGKNTERGQWNPQTASCETCIVQEGTELIQVGCLIGDHLPWSQNPKCLYSHCKPEPEENKLLSHPGGASRKQHSSRSACPQGLEPRFTSPGCQKKRRENPSKYKVRCRWPDANVTSSERTCHDSVSQRRAATNVSQSVSTYQETRARVKISVNDRRQKQNQRYFR